jgi:dihydrofolate reductase
MVIGGAEVYAQAMPDASRIYLTRVFGRHPGDAFFPFLDMSKWNLTSSIDLATHSYLIYDRQG